MSLLSALIMSLLLFQLCFSVSVMPILSVSVISLICFSYAYHICFSYVSLICFSYVPYLCQLCLSYLFQLCLSYLFQLCLSNCFSWPRWLSWMHVRLVISRLRVQFLLGRQHSFVKIDNEIFSTVILSLQLIQEGQLSVSGKRMCTILVNRLED